MITRSRARASAARQNAEPSSTGSNSRTTRGTVTRGTTTRATDTSDVSLLAFTHNIIAAELFRSRFHKTKKLVVIESKLARSCEQVILLNDKIRGLTKRYQKARAEGHKSFRYNLRIRLAAVEGVRNMYYEYARDRAEEVAELRKELYNQNVQIVAASDPDSEDNFSDMADTDESSDSDFETDEEEEGVEVL